MAQYLYANNARSSLLTNIAPTDPSIVLPGGDGAKFPNPTGGKTFLLTIEDDSGNTEIVECTARAADTLTVTRGREGTTAQAFLASTLVEMRITAGMLGQIDWTEYADQPSGLATLDASGEIPIAQFQTPLQIYGDARWNPNLGYTPVQQGGGAGQLTNKVYMGWNGADVTLQVDATAIGSIATKAWVASTTVAAANKLANARNIALTGPVTGSANFDGSGNIAIATSIGAAALSTAMTNGLDAALAARPLNNATNNASITFTGTITGGSVVDNSDARIKSNIDGMSISDATDIVMRSRPVRYHNLQTGRDDFGLIADEQGEVTPELLFDGPGDKKLKGLAYQRLTSPIIRVLQVLIEDARERGVAI